MESSIAELRNADVINTFYDGIKSFGQYSVTQEDVIRSIMKKGAPRFYVSYDKACRFVSLLERGRELPLRNKNKIEMYKEIHRRYRTFVEEHNCKGYRILESIILQPAPSFYMEMKTFRDIIYKNHKERRKCQL